MKFVYVLLGIAIGIIISHSLLDFTHETWLTDAPHPVVYISNSIDKKELHFRYVGGDDITVSYAQLEMGENEAQALDAILKHNRENIFISCGALCTVYVGEGSGGLIVNKLLHRLFPPHSS